LLSKGGSPLACNTRHFDLQSKPLQSTWGRHAFCQFGFCLAIAFPWRPR
jgi:hypothetical protein